MNAVTLAIASIRTRFFHSLLCAGAAAAGLALLCAAFLLSQALNEGLSRNMRGIDIVAGAKGSPLQLVLSSIYHADVPSGNIEMADAEKLIRNPQVRRAIPLAMGDNYKGWRVIGTTPDYISLYHAEFSQGRVFSRPFETVAGAMTGLKIGETFAARHGFAADSDDVHDAFLYTVTGILKPTGTVLDRLLLTPVESVQTLHAAHEDHAHEEPGHEESAEEEAAEKALAHQVTAVLLQVKTPLAVMNLPRALNQSTNIMAASPGYEMTRLSSSLGLGRDMVTVLGIGVVALSALMLLSALASSLAARRYDLAVMRVLGASRVKLFATVIAEGLALSAAGALLGLALGHGAAYAAASAITTLRGIVLPETLLRPQVMDLAFLALSLCAGFLAALVPALSAARTDISGLLARGQA